MNCYLEIDVHHVPHRQLQFQQVKDGLTAFEELIDLGAVRVSRRNAGTIKALRKTFAEKWTMLDELLAHVIDTAMIEAGDEIRKEQGTPFDQEQEE